MNDWKIWNKDSDVEMGLILGQRKSYLKWNAQNNL